MGVQDRKIFTITCEQCKATDEVKMLDKGTSFNGVWWVGSPESDLFAIEYEGGGSEEIEITMATCNACDIEVNVDYRYKVF